MNPLSPREIRRRRLANQHLYAPHLTDPAAVVSSMVAVQAQEYAMAKWALALRMRGAVTDDEVEVAIDSGRIVRLHVLRPTWHFVAAEDLRMVLQVTAARVHQANAFMYRKLGLDAARFERFEALLRRELAGERHLTRTEIVAAAPADLVAGETFTVAYLLMHAELEGLVCSGPRRGNQFTYALVDERIPSAVERDADEALAEFVRRYVSTRAPATVADLTTWSGLTMAQAKRGVALLGDEVTQVEQDGVAYLLAGEGPPRGRGLTDFLLPDYDEYGMSYKDRSAIAHPERGYWMPWNRPIVLDGVIAGAWKRTVKGSTVVVETDLFDVAADDPRIRVAAEDYARFHGRELEMRAASPGVISG